MGSRLSNLFTTNKSNKKTKKSKKLQKRNKSKSSGRKKELIDDL
jgi:hypothetical protein